MLTSFVENIETIKEKYRQVDIQCEAFVDKTAYFLTGFENI